MHDNTIVISYYLEYYNKVYRSRMLGIQNYYIHVSDSGKIFVGTV